MSENRNYIVAIALSIVVLLGWQYFIAAPRLEAERQRRAIEQAQQVASQPAPAATAPAGTTPAGTAPSTANPELPAAATAPIVPLPREEVVKNAPRIAIDTPALTGSINLHGGRLDDLKLKTYHQTIDPTSPQIVLLSPAGSPNAYFADFLWTADAGAPVKVPGPDAVWTQVGAGALSATTPVTIGFDNGEGLSFRRTIAVDEKYMFTVSDEVVSTSDKAATLYPLASVSRHGTPTTAGYYILHEGAIGVFGDEGLKEVSYKDLKAKQKVDAAKVAGGWIGFVDKYWATALIPDAAKSVQPMFRAGLIGTLDFYQSVMAGEAVTVAAGGKAAVSSHFFAGAKEVKTIKAYEESLKIGRFDLLIDWGWFWFLTKPLFMLIDWLYGVTGNFGLAILAVTVIIKGLFFPLANKSYDSMSKMKKVQPEMKELQERFKDDKVKQQQALMELYKRERINPLAGCLPIVIQIPVFFSLYKVLFVTIEMRQAPFFGWIHDLAAPDPTSLFNLFGLIPYAPPQFLMLGAWPLVMGVTMFVQMKLNPPPPDPTQKMLFDWMPLLFTFMLASMPAGLVIYWAWNNSLSIAQQSIIMKKNGVRIELWDNVKSLFVKPKSAAS